MLHTKSQGHRPSGSGEDFKGFLPYMGLAAILVMWPGPFEQTFVPPSKGVSIWNLGSIGPVVSELKKRRCLKMLTDAGVIVILLAHIEAFGSGGLKMRTNSFKLYIKNEAFDHLIIGSGTLWLPLPLWSYYYGNLGFVTYSGVIVKLSSNKGWQKWELSNMFASRLHRLVNNFCVVMSKRR